MSFGVVPSCLNINWCLNPRGSACSHCVIDSNNQWTIIVFRWFPLCAAIMHRFIVWLLCSKALHWRCKRCLLRVRWRLASDVQNCECLPCSCSLKIAQEIHSKASACPDTVKGASYLIFIAISAIIKCFHAFAGKFVVIQHVHGCRSM